MSEQIILALEAELAAHQARLAVIRIRLAEYGIDAPKSLLIDRDEACAAIARLTAELRARGVPVDDTPGVDAAAPAAAPATAPQIGQAEIASIISLPGANFAGAQGIQITGVQLGPRPPRQPPEDEPAE
ncbi:MAG: hypothetical protein JST60_01675 [Chloroflexi bacterium SZAS-1]|nr:hypothetical protein [Chloroflexi bacterium SZAS-1]